MNSLKENIAYKMNDSDLVVFNQIIGVWQLEEASVKNIETGAVTSAYGEGAAGFIHYASSGRMTALITHGGRIEKLDGDRQSCPPEQKIEAYSTSMAYAGRFWIEGDKVIHHVEVSTFPNWVDTDLIRYFKTDGDSISLITAPQMQDGVMSTIELIWNRCG